MEHSHPVLDFTLNGDLPQI